MDPAPPQPPKPPQKQKGQPLVPQETHVLQQMLEDNARLLKLINEHQAMGKFKECEHYQRMAHKNLTYLAALADAQQRAKPQHQAAQAHWETK